MSEKPLLKSLSVIIPTYNREQLLAKALDGYLRQSSPQFIHEVLVIDDGSTDNTELMVRDFIARSVFPIRYLRQSNKGPAAARNLGIKEAGSELVLFSDSDIIPQVDLVEQHINWHRENPQITTVVLGYVTWDPAVNPTPFMQWYGDNRLFAFRELRNKREADFHSFYTCNISLKTEFLRAVGKFDEDFKNAAYEDTELGYRLGRKGMLLLYNPKAIGYHHQFFSFHDACKKALANGGATELFFRKEAGQVLAKEIQRRQSRVGHRVATVLAPVILKALSPLRHFLDSSLALPGVVYRLFFWAATGERKRQNALTALSGGARQRALH
jgi:glycosyltransferase involved in cell wall biosynthesis